MSSTTDVYNRQLDKCNRQIQEVSLSFFFNSSKVRVCLNNISKFSSCLTENTLYSITKICQLNVVWENICCLLCEYNRIYNYTNSMEQSPCSEANIPQLVNNSPHFILCSLLHSKPSTCPFPEPDQSSPCSTIPLF